MMPSRAPSDHWLTQLLAIARGHVSTASRWLAGGDEDDSWRAGTLEPPWALALSGFARLEPPFPGAAAPESRPHEASKPRERQEQALDTRRWQPSGQACPSSIRSLANRSGNQLRVTLCPSGLRATLYVRYLSPHGERYCTWAVEVACWGLTGGACEPTPGWLLLTS